MRQMRQKGSSLAICVFVWASVFLLGINALAQSTTSIHGVVTDPTGAIVPGVNVTIEDKGTGATHTAITDDAGRYQILQIPPGIYKIRAELSGFKTVIQDNLQLLVNTPTTLNLKFVEVGQVSESVEVTAAAAAINSVDALIGNTIQNNQIVSLPLEGRDIVKLLSLQPGLAYTV